ncbi:MAG: FAD-dependent oxidoreductase [Candidatus Dependentiae bacterium]
MNKVNQKKYEYLIIGQGLAGSILSYKLMQAGKKCLVINRFNPNAASYVAGGIFSPIAGQRIAKIWQADEIAPVLPNFYQELEKTLSISFFYQVPYIKLLITDDLKKNAQKRLDDPAYRQYIKPISYEINKKKFNAIEIQHTGWVDTEILLNSYRALLKTKHTYLEDWFDETQLTVNENEIHYKNICAKKIIFCNGLQAINNRFFNQEKMNPTKGELLTIKMNKSIAQIISSNVFLLPIGNNLYHVGATFERDYKDTFPSEKGRNWLCSELEKIINVPYEIISHKAGIRPTTLGHRPITKWHNTYKNIGIFSGFGAKGVSYIPYCVQSLLG